MKKHKVMYIISIILSLLALIVSSLLLLFTLEINDIIFIPNFGNDNGNGYALIVLAIFWFLVLLMMVGSQLLSAILVILLSLSSIIMLIINIIKKYKRTPCIILLSINVILLIFGLYCLCFNFLCKIQ